ncbi:glycine n-acyltransferase-like protein 3 [Limosa lapponica baueri]|uniref:Glycine N-acyltransferase-like protein n=1 Tax=Limosa lapponica baueri TaxID=1758121 RepID=A0A2I0T201_LIMLA|nr:glycine n-acyltransferase-like protein 3 [Limosa lapponica baueri]
MQPPHAFPPHCRLPPGLRLSPVSPSHVPLLNATWAFGGNARSRRFLLGLVQTLPSACLLGPRGRPVSWSLVDPLGCLSHGYTLPAWRGQGLTGVTLGALGRQLHARGFPIYLGVLPQNTSSQRAVRAVGFQPQPGTFYTLVVTSQ